MVLLFGLNTANAKQCSEAVPSNPQGHWSFRLIDGRKCWYEGENNFPKSLLQWPEQNSALSPRRAQRELNPARSGTMDDVVSGRVATVAELCAREKCTVRQVNMTISLAFLAPNLVKAAVEGRLPRGIGIERLRDPPTEWSRQFEALGLNPE